MSKPLIYDLGQVDIGAGGTTTPFEICFQYGWSLAPTVTGTPGTAKYTVEVSQDNVTYFDYKTLATGVDIEDAVEDNTFSWSWIRIAVTPGGPSAGTVDFSIELKLI